MIHISPWRKRLLWSVSDTMLLVFVAYFSDYVASGKNALANGIILSVLFAITLILNMISRHSRRIRGSGNRWVIFSNSSVAWLLAAFFGALSGGLTTLISLIFEFPVLLFVVGLFLGLVFALIDLSKETQDLVEKMNQTRPILAAFL
jgi:hypothetical protein